MSITCLYCQFTFNNVYAHSDLGPYLILFDEAHDQYYTYSNERFKTALDYLNQTYDFNVYLNSEAFNNLTILLTYDLIIITNPGPNGNFSSTELEILKNYTELGGNLFLLCNYYDVDNPLRDEKVIGHASFLNEIITALNLPASFIEYDLQNDPSTVPGMERWIVEIEDSSFQNFHPIKQKIKTILTFTSGINVTQSLETIATGPIESYLIKNETNKLNETPWLVTTQLAKSKITLCGSTVMFSDQNVTNKTGKKYTDISWINAADNLRLWANIIQWILINEIPNLFTMFLIFTCAFFAIGAGLYLYQSYFVSPKSTPIDLTKQNLQDERAMILKEARRRAKEGQYHAAAQLYKRAAKLSNKLGDYQAESNYTDKYRQFLSKSKK